MGQSGFYSLTVASRRSGATTKAKDIMGGLPRVVELFEAGNSPSTTDTAMLFHPSGVNRS